VFRDNDWMYRVAWCKADAPFRVQQSAGIEFRNWR
jgi:hypothetical protein